jgi:hypothetical protein
MENSVKFNIYVHEGECINKNREYFFDLNEKIIDIKNKILKETFNDKFNHLDMENITDKIYKDYGKLFFDKGLIPSTIDNYKLSQFTNANRDFSFIVIGSNIKKDVEVKKKKEDNSLLKRIIMEDRKKNNKNNEFIMFDDDFPPLK